MPKYDAIISQATASHRPGTARAIHEPTPEPMLVGLELSDIVYKPATWFRLNPVNEPFRALKGAQYLDDLEADIRAVGVTENLVAMADGLLLAGESRVIVAGRISADYKLPVRIVLSELSAEEQERRLILSNLLRFEIPEDMRLILARKVGLYTKVLRSEAADITGKSLRQVKRDAGLVKDAEALAAAEGRADPTADDIKRAREKRNEARKASTGNDKVRILLSPILSNMDDEGGACAEYACEIREVLGWQE